MVGSAPEESEFQAVFDMFDADGGDDISSEQLVEMMKILAQNPTRKEINASIEEMDKERSGTTDFEELLMIMTRRTKEEVKGFFKDHLVELFCVFDKNVDRFIDCVELKFMIYSGGEHFGDEEVNELMREWDKNNDGKLDLDEWLEMIN
ncbi:troponin C, skeletal muscle-like [Chiloscyllium punctatum]|uniref:troponin C, skeletal muscle-like n=1 Tax=Chiloscyllium punctatum TaxID=137246 RepID=UPI003B636A94